MRQTYYEGPDTLQRDRLPDRRFTLAYRPRLPKGAASITGAAVLAIVLLSLLLTLATRISGFLVSFPVAILFSISGPIAGVVLLIQRRTPRLVLAAIPTGLLIWSLLAFLHVSSSPRLLYFVGFGPVLAATLWTADAIAAHHFRWMAADPRYHCVAYRRWNHRWRHRFAVPAYRRAFVYILLAYAFGAILFLPPDATLAPRPLRAALLVLTVTVLLVAGAVCVILQESCPARRLSRLLSPLVNWFTYSPHLYARGLLQIPVVPFGSVSGLSRQVITGTVLFTLTASMVSTACYFPVTMVSARQWQSMAEISNDELTKKPTLQEVARQLDAEQATHLDRLPASYRLRYLDLMASRHELDAIAAAKRRAYEGLIAYTNSAPEAWLPVLARQSPSHSSFVISTLFISITLSTLCPIMVFLAVVVIVNRPFLDDLAPRLTTRFHHHTDWDGHVDRIQRSEHDTERRSLWLGTHADADYPILLHREVLREHAHILGDSGSGKTALALAPMATQLIRMAGRDVRLPATKNNPHSSVVVIDLKGDLALFHGARIEAEQAGLPFKWFTNTLHCSTFAFNPFLQTHFASLSLNQRTEIIADALALSHGEGYGRSYFSRVNRRILSRMLHAYGENVRSFRDLYELTLQPTTLGKRLGLHAKEAEDAGELFATLETLATFQAVNETCPELVAHQIDMQGVVTHSQVVYFFLQSAIESASVREIGKLALYCLLSAAAQRGPADHQVYLFIDEFQQIVSENLEIILRQARSMGIATILANQTISDLETSTANLIPTVQGNTRFKQFFASTDLKQQDDLIKASGETIDYIQHWSQNTDNQPSSETEAILPRISRNDVIRLTDDSNLSIVHIPRGKGCAQMAGFPFIARSQFHISEETYEERQHMPWPPGSPGTLTPTSQPLYEPEAGQVKRVVNETNGCPVHHGKPTPFCAQPAATGLSPKPNRRPKPKGPLHPAMPPEVAAVPKAEVLPRADVSQNIGAVPDSVVQKNAKALSPPESRRDVGASPTTGVQPEVHASASPDTATEAKAQTPSEKTLPPETWPDVHTQVNTETPPYPATPPETAAASLAKTPSATERSADCAPIVEAQTHANAETSETPQTRPTPDNQPADDQPEREMRPSLFASRFEELEARRREREQLQRNHAGKPQGEAQ